MYECYLTFQSLTLAQYASKMLKNYGIRAPVVSTPSSLSSEGCGYSIQIMRADLERGKKYLEKMMIPYKNVLFNGYKQLDEGGGI